MLKDLIPVLSVMAGGIIGFLGASLQQRASMKLDRRKLIRERLEEVYLLSRQVEEWGLDQVKELTSFFTGLGNHKPESGAEDPPTVRLVMLAKIYEPRIADVSVRLSGEADILQHNVFEYYLDTAKAEEPLPIEALQKAIMPLDDLQKTGKELRALIERCVQDYI